MDYRYDLFISFKNSTEEGLTEDRNVAKSFFERLSGDGFNVFFSNQVLSDAGVSNYMFEIQSAIEGAKAFLLVFSHIEYITHGWVAQEWMTFLNILLKDPRRSIFIYSINKQAAELPPFLRPYECFDDFNSALSHMANGITGEKPSLSGSSAIGKRDFLNAYWGLFGNGGFDVFIDRPMGDKFYNYEVYRLKSRFLSDGDIRKYTTGLETLIKERNNPLAAYLLSRHYRNFRYLDLSLSRALSKTAYDSFLKKVGNSSTNGEIGLWILTDNCEYDGAFYMCDVIHDVLDAYDVGTEIRILRPGELDSADFGNHRKTVLFWSDVCLDIPGTFIEKMHDHRDKLLLALNSFGENAVPYDIKDLDLFENNNTEITKLCRILLS